MLEAPPSTARTPCRTSQRCDRDSACVARASRSPLCTWKFRTPTPAFPVIALSFLAETRLPVSPLSSTSASPRRRSKKQLDNALTVREYSHILHLVLLEPASFGKSLMAASPKTAIHLHVVAYTLPVRRPPRRDGATRPREGRYVG